MNGKHVRLTVSALLTLLPACSSREEHLSVSGKVTFGDMPLSSGAVILRPDSSKGNTSKHEPRGKIEADGRYQTYTAQQAGAVPGWYKVGVVATEPADPKNPYAVPKSVIPVIYNDPDKSGLSFEVVKNAGPEAYDLKLPRK